MSSNFEKKAKKNNKGIVILSVLLILVILLFAGYVLVDREIISFEKNANNSDVVEKEEKIELDINSRLVQSLYDSVTVDGDGWFKYWVYSDSRDTSSFDDFYVESASEQIKMNIVGMNLAESKRKYFNCSSVNIPKENSFGVSVCYANTMPGYEGIYTPRSYDREYVEGVYKEIFGKDAKLDTSADIPVNYFGSESYSYVASEGVYVLYVTESGGTGGPGGYTTSLKSATKDGDKLYIYENVKNEIYDDNEVLQKTVNFVMVYTFELEDDGMYKFVSRVKKDK